MAKGIILGLSAQLAFGLTFINPAVFYENQQFVKSGLILFTKCMLSKTLGQKMPVIGRKQIVGFFSLLSALSYLRQNN